MYYFFCCWCFIWKKIMFQHFLLISSWSQNFETNCNEQIKKAIQKYVQEHKNFKPSNFLFLFCFEHVWYICFPELVSVPCPNQTLETEISKTPRPKLKLNKHSFRVDLALSEYNFNFCRVVFEKLVSKVWLGYDTDTSSRKQLYNMIIWFIW